MNPQARAEHLRQNDLFKRDYEHANTQLAVWALTLRKHDTSVEHLRSFVDAGMALSKVCEHSLSDENPLNVLFWLNNRLNMEIDKGCRDCRYKAICMQQLYQVKDRIMMLCRSLGKGNVVPLFAA